MIKYDLMTVLIGHYVIDALVIALPLVKSFSLYFRVPGIVILSLALIPLIPVFGRMLKKEALI